MGPDCEPIGDGPIRVFLINHHPTFLGLLARYVGGDPACLVVGQATDIDRGLASLVAARPGVVVVDPPLDDLPLGAAIRRLRAALPGAGIIVLSAHPDHAYRRAALDAGADACVLKTEAAGALLPAIKRLGRAGSGG